MTLRKVRKAEHQSYFQERRGFTSVELLVVIAIVLLLLSLAFPAVLRARETSLRTTCLNNARQLAVAWTLYGTDNADRLVINVDGIAGGFTNWVAGNMALPGLDRDNRLLVDSRYSLLGAYLRSPAIFKCAADESRFVRSVSMNCRLNPVRIGAAPRWISGLGSRFKTFRTLGEIGRPSSVFLTAEENPSSINDGFFAVDMSNTGDPSGEGESRAYYLIDRPAAHHSKSAVISFSDAHVELKRWAEKTTFIEPRAGWHTSPYDRDASWLQANCTYE